MASTRKKFKVGLNRERTRSWLKSLSTTELVWIRNEINKRVTDLIQNLNIVDQERKALMFHKYDDNCEE